MITKQLEQALYIRDLISEKKQVKNAMKDKNYDTIWFKAAQDDLPDHFHSEMEPTYFELLMGLDAFDCQEDAPHDEIDKIITYIHKKIDDKVKDNINFLKLRLESIKDNIKYLKNKFQEEYKISWKETILLAESEAIEENTVPNSSKLNLDDILDKISDKGINSLTTDEKKFLKSKGKGSGNDKGDKK